MTTLTIKRNRGWFGLIRSAVILADGIEVGRVKAGESVTIQLPEGTGNLSARMDWAQSRPVPVSRFKDGQVIYLNSRFTLNPLRNIGILTMPMDFENEPR